VTAEGFDSVMHLHVRAALFGMKYAVPLMREAGGGSIISTASVAGLQAGYGPILYSIAKAAIIHMTKVTAAQLAAVQHPRQLHLPRPDRDQHLRAAAWACRANRRNAHRCHRGSGEEFATDPARRPAARHRRRRALFRQRRIGLGDGPGARHRRRADARPQACNRWRLSCRSSRRSASTPRPWRRWQQGGAEPPYRR
jgi:hypothetical protein